VADEGVLGRAGVDEDAIAGCQRMAIRCLGADPPEPDLQQLHWSLVVALWLHNAGMKKSLLPLQIGVRSDILLTRNRDYDFEVALSRAPGVHRVAWLGRRDA
jgi:hypothetical protein